MGVHLIGVYHTGMHLTAVRLTGVSCVSHRRDLTGVHP